MIDYRDSHLQKGSDYDHCLEQDDISVYLGGREAELLQRLVRRYYPRGIPRYLDFACGTGRITSILEGAAEQSFGIDIAPSMVEQAKARCSKTTFHVVDLTRSEVDIEPVDLITAFRFFGNAQHSLRMQVLAALRAKLRRGGYLIINNHRNPHALQNMTFRGTTARTDMDLDYAKLKRLLADAGLEIVRSYGMGAWVIRHSLARRKYLMSPMARMLEPISLWPGMQWIAPDMIVVARRH